MKRIKEIFKKYWLCLPLRKDYFLFLLLTQALATTANILIPYTAAGIIKFLTINDYATAIKWTVYFFLAGTSQFIFTYFNYYFGGKDSIYCYTNLKRKAFEKISTYDIDFTKTKNIDELLQASSSDIYNVIEINGNLSDIIITFFKIILIIILITLVSPIVGTTVLIFCILYLILIDFFNTKITYHLNQQKKYQDKLAGVFIEAMSSADELKVYNMKNSFKNYFSALNKKFSESFRKKRRYSDIEENFLQLIIELGEVIIYFITIILLFNGNFTLDKIVLVIGYFTLLKEDLSYLLIDCIQNIINKSISVDRIFSIIKYKPKDKIILGKDNTDDIEGIVEFKNVTFSYLGKKTLKNISFQAKPKELTAIVGRSGSGKSAILNNILRLYIPDSGQITIDGKDIYDYTNEVFQTNVSVVSQKNFLFNLSIKNNLALVEPNFKKQQEICKKLGIHEEILKLSQGYNTILEDNANNISTNLKQLLSIARSILTKAEILLFDEITSPLDKQSTKKVIKIFKELSKTHTVIIITHKKEVMEQADHLIILAKGKKVADGTVESLQNNKYYLNLENGSSCSKE